MTARWVLVAEVTDPQALADFYRAYGDDDAADKTLAEGCGAWPVDSFDWEDEAWVAEGEQPGMPGLTYRVEAREVAL